MVVSGGDVFGVTDEVEVDMIAVRTTVTFDAIGTVCKHLLANDWMEEATIGGSADEV